MHPNARLLEKFYASVQAHDHRAAATAIIRALLFEDIAFKLPDKQMIHAMWHMISETDLQLSYAIETADDRHGSARWIADYTFRDTGRKVHNELRSKFTFKDGVIIAQRDDCDAWSWGMQAFGPVKGVLSWLFPGKRRKKAMEKLDAFIERHPQYRSGNGGALAAGLAVPT